MFASFQVILSMQLMAATQDLQIFLKFTLVFLVGNRMAEVRYACLLFRRCSRRSWNNRRLFCLLVSNHWDNYLFICLLLVRSNMRWRCINLIKLNNFKNGFVKLNLSISTLIKISIVYSLLADIMAISENRVSKCIEIILTEGLAKSIHTIFPRIYKLKPKQ